MDIRNFKAAKPDTLAARLSQVSAMEWVLRLLLSGKAHISRSPHVDLTELVFNGLRYCISEPEDCSKLVSVIGVDKIKSALNSR